MENLPIRELLENKIPQFLHGKPEVERCSKGTLQLNLTGEGGGTWTIEFDEGMKVASGATGSADCAITMEASDFRKLIPSSQTAWARAFLDGRIDFSGDLEVAAEIGKTLYKYFESLRKMAREWPT